MKEKIHCCNCKYNQGSLSRTTQQFPCCECKDHDHFEKYIGENLYELPQYPIERELFEKLFIGIDKRLFWEGINEAETDTFRYWKYGDEFYILHKDSGTLINWYKHLGRCNTCNKKLSIDEYKKFVSDFEEDLSYLGY